jgi:hypothetical protein
MLTRFLKGRTVRAHTGGLHMRVFLRLIALAVTFSPLSSWAQVSATNITVDGPFLVRYAANLNMADSVFDITNGGARGAGLSSGTSASVTGAICANVYTFSPDEQMIACCSCPVTPNGLVSLSAQKDLISNALTPAVPTSIVVKLLGSAPVGGSCASSAASPGALASGLLAWGTTAHIVDTVAGKQGGLTETEFLPATLSAGELTRITTLCTFIQANGSGFGICRSCRLGGLSVE